MFGLKSRTDLAALSEVDRLRYLARAQWILYVLVILFGLQVAFVEDIRAAGLLLVGLGFLGFVSALAMTLRIRRLTRARRERPR